jgi:hypothetical protein
MNPIPMHDCPAGQKEEFLKNLVHMARTYGWQADYTEVADFVRWCHDKLGVSSRNVDLTPYEDEMGM